MENYHYYLVQQTGEVIDWTTAQTLGEAADLLKVNIKSWFPINKGKVMGAGIVEDKANKELTLGIYWIKS